MNYFNELQKTLSQLDPSPLLNFIRACEGTLWLAGNGGSASTAQHWACDLSKAAGRRVQALGANGAVLTAWANDESYSSALAEELRRSASDKGDALICLSCSGMSPNLITAISVARRLHMPCALLTSQRYFGALKCDPVIRVPHEHYGIIEDCHLAIGHWLTEELKKEGAHG